MNGLFGSGLIACGDMGRRNPVVKEHGVLQRRNPVVKELGVLQGWPGGGVACLGRLGVRQADLVDADVACFAEKAIIWSGSLHCDSHSMHFRSLGFGTVQLQCSHHNDVLRGVNDFSHLTDF